MQRKLKRLTALTLIRHLLAYTIAGGIAGWLCGYLSSIGGDGWVALLLFFILMPCLNLLTIYRGLFIPLLSGLGLNYTAIILSWVVCSITYPSALSHYFDNSYDLWHTLIILLIAVMVHLPLLAILIAWTLLDEGRIRTTNCLACVYPLIGLQENKCPECGKMFTLYEQGVSEEELSIS